MKKRVKLVIIGVSTGLLLGVSINNKTENVSDLNAQYQNEIDMGVYDENPEINYMTNPMTGEKTLIEKD